MSGKGAIIHRTADVCVLRITLFAVDAHDKRLELRDSGWSEVRRMILFERPIFLSHSLRKVVYVMQATY